MTIANLRGCFYRHKKFLTTAALHLDSTRSESLDTAASLLIAVRLTMTSTTFPLAEQIVPAYLFVVARLTITSAADPLAETIHVSAPP